MYEQQFCPKLCILISTRAGLEVVATGTGMGHDTGKLALVVDDDAVSAGGAAAVDPAVLQDGEFVVRTRDAVEGEALVVVVLLWVLGVAGERALADEVAGCVGGVGDCCGRKPGLVIFFSFELKGSNDE